MSGDGYDLISWCSDPKATASSLLARARGLRAIAATERGPKFPTPWPETELPAGLVDRLEWSAACEAWRREKIGSPVMDGLRLPRLPWSPGPEGVIAELVGFALASLQRIDDLAGRLRSADAATIGLRRELTDAAAWREAAEGVEADLRAQLAAARQDAAQARQDARNAERDRDAAQAKADAWRVSSQAAADALATLRAALRIHAPDDAGGAAIVLSKDGSP